jgi:hypothetical protein
MFWGLVIGDSLELGCSDLKFEKYSCRTTAPVAVSKDWQAVRLPHSPKTVSLIRQLRLHVSRS